MGFAHVHKGLQRCRRYALAELMEMAGFSLLERAAANVRVTGIQVDADMVRPHAPSWYHCDIVTDPPVAAEKSKIV